MYFYASFVNSTSLLAFLWVTYDLIILSERRGFLFTCLSALCHRFRQVNMALQFHYSDIHFTVITSKKVPKTDLKFLMFASNDS